jgi:hypothetical protein
MAKINQKKLRHIIRASSHEEAFAGIVIDLIRAYLHDGLLTPQGADFLVDADVLVLGDEDIVIPPVLSVDDDDEEETGDDEELPF